MFSKTMRYLNTILAVALLYFTVPLAIGNVSTERAEAQSLGSQTFDGAHQGNPDFFFLPPLLADPSQHLLFDAGKFDSTRSPRVEICLLENDQCSANQPNGYPRFFNPGIKSDEIRVDETYENYITNWELNRRTSESGTYRLSVFLDDVLLGFSDVLVVSSIREASGLDNGQIYVLAGGQQPITFRIEEDVLDWRIVNPQGGQLTFANGVMFDVPAGAVDQNVAIRLGELPFATVQSLLDARPYRSSKKYLLGGFTAEPDGLSFAKEVKATLPINPPSGMPMQAEVHLETLEYWLARTDLIFNPDTAKAEITLTHFSGHIVVDLADLAARNEQFEVPEWCANLSYNVISVEGDWARGDGCQVIGKDVRTVYSACNITVIDNVSETTPECDQDFQLLPVIQQTSLQECRSETLQATVKDHKGNLWDVPLTWTSNNTSVLAVGKLSGNATGMGEGTAVVQAATPDPRFSTTQLLNVAAAPAIIISPLDPSMKVNDSIQLTATDAFGKAYACDVRSGIVWEDLDKVPTTWSTVDFSVVSVDSQSGLVTGLSPGSAEVTAISFDQNATTTVEVVEEEEPPPSGCDLSLTIAHTEIAGTEGVSFRRNGERDSSITLEPGWTRQFVVKALDYSVSPPINAIPACLSDEWTWRSLNESIATVDQNGLVTAQSYATCAAGRPCLAYLRAEHVDFPQIHADAVVNVAESWLDKYRDGIRDPEFRYHTFGCSGGPASCDYTDEVREQLYILCPLPVYIQYGQSYTCIISINPYTDPNQDCDPAVDCIGTLIERREHWGGILEEVSYFDMPITYRDEYTMRFWW